VTEAPEQESGLSPIVEWAPNSTNTWATTQDVMNITGYQASEQEVMAAGFIIDLHTGRPYSFTGPDGSSYNWYENTGDIDAYYLKMAVAYQVVWMTQQPDLMTRLDLANLPAKGRPLTINVGALILGPLAKKALGRVSWLRSRALHVRSPFEDLYTANSVNFGEFIFPWQPIGGWAPGVDY
jgi:hypothetical protein